MIRGLLFIKVLFQRMIKCKRVQNNMNVIALFGFLGLCAGLKPTLCVQEQETKKDNEKVLN